MSITDSWAESESDPLLIIMNIGEEQGDHLIPADVHDQREDQEWKQRMIGTYTVVVVVGGVEGKKKGRKKESRAAKYSSCRQGCPLLQQVRGESPRTCWL